MRRSLRVVLAVAFVTVAVAGVAYAASTTLTSKKLTVLSAPAPTSTADNAMTIALANGGTSKKADLDDSVTITFSPSVKADTFCSGWTGTATSFTLGTATNDVKIRIVDGGAANDTLTVSAFSATCTGGFHLGTIDLGSTAYVGDGNAEFYGNGNDKSSVVWAPPVAPATTGTMVIVLGTPQSGTRNTVTTPITTTFTPDSTNLRDTGNNPVTGTATTGSTL